MEYSQYDPMTYKVNKRLHAVVSPCTFGAKPLARDPHARDRTLRRDGTEPVDLFQKTVRGLMSVAPIPCGLRTGASVPPPTRQGRALDARGRGLGAPRRPGKP